MALTSTVLFGTPQNEIGSLLKQKISNAISCKIVTGFATVEGVKVLEGPLTQNPGILKTFVIGAGTYKAYEALDKLIAHGVSAQNLFVHLGHTRNTKSEAKYPFYRYHPMLHSKIYYMENADGTACALVGSHNMTGFALMGLNGEASIMIEGDSNDPEFDKIRNHIGHAKHEAVAYRPEMKEAYSWWTNQFMEGLVLKTDDIPSDSDNTKTILIFCEYKKGQPKAQEILYFELPEALGKIQSLRADVHLFIFEKLPGSPSECIANISSANQNFWCRIEGIENNEGGKELATNWVIDDQFNPILQRAPRPFRPAPKPEMQQIRVRLRNSVFGNFEYLFGKLDTNWLPILDPEKDVKYEISYSKEIEKLKLIPPETQGWFLVKDLTSQEPKNDKNSERYEIALKAMEPESGAFILFSTGRRKLKQKRS